MTEERVKENHNQNMCEKHKIKKDYLFCMESRCRDRLCCEKCYSEDNKHNLHKEDKGDEEMEETKEMEEINKKGK